MNEADNREARAGSVADRSPATISVPAEDLAGEAQAAHSVRARGKLHAARWHLKDVCSARCVEHVRPREEARERLAVLAVADEAEAGGRRNFACDAAHAAAPAGEQDVLSSGSGLIKRDSLIRVSHGLRMTRAGPSPTYCVAMGTAGGDR
jgi:hypothetical protein